MAPAYRLTKEEFSRRWRLWIQSSDWQAFRLRAFAYFGSHCAVCDSDWRGVCPLQLHHLTYYKRGELIFGHETFNDVRPLCERHHPKGKLSLYGIKLSRKAYRWRKRVKRVWRGLVHVLRLLKPPQ